MLVRRIAILISYNSPPAVLGSILTILKTMMMIVVMIVMKKAVFDKLKPAPCMQW